MRCHSRNVVVTLCCLTFALLAGCGEGSQSSGESCADLACHAKASCVASEGQARCECNAGYEGDGVTCSDVDECDGANDCDANSTCTNQEGGYACTCAAGFSGDGKSCQDDDECAMTNECGANSQCTNLEGDYACACSPGYSGDGKICEVGVLLVDSSEHQNCAVLGNGSLYCWGLNSSGQLGLGDKVGRGDNPGEMGDALPAVDLGTGHTAKSVAVGESHVCALLDDGTVKCWGLNHVGQLGAGDGVTRGDGPGEMGDARPIVELGQGRTATSLAAGDNHTCALLDDESVKCWGFGSIGQLGLGSNLDRGDEPGEMGDALPAIELGTGRKAKRIYAHGSQTCAILDNGAAKCWGHNDRAQLGLGDLENRGDNPSEMGDALPAVDLGTGRTAKDMAMGIFHTCALLDDGAVKCWGDGGFGQVGLGDTSRRGDEAGEMGDALPALGLGTGRTAQAIFGGTLHSCAVLDDASLRCWGRNDEGQLGLGDTETRGDQPEEMGDDLPVVQLGTGVSVIGAALGAYHSCALLNNSSVKCWGEAYSGQLGLGDIEVRGDESGEMGDALPVVDLPLP